MVLENKLKSSKEFKCRGFDKSGNPIFPEGKGLHTIVKIYTNGHSIPLCGAFIEESKCNAYTIKSGKIRKSSIGPCPYKS